MKRQEIKDLKIDDCLVFTEISNGIRYKGFSIFYADSTQFLRIAWVDDDKSVYQGRCTNIEFFIEICKNVIEKGFFQVGYKGRCKRCNKEVDIEDLVNGNFDCAEYPQHLDDDDYYCMECINE